MCSVFYSACFISFMSNCNFTCALCRSNNNVCACNNLCNTNIYYRSNKLNSLGFALTSRSNSKLKSISSRSYYISSIFMV